MIVSLIQKPFQLIDNGFSFWKLNLTCASDNYFFVAITSKIYCYEVLNRPKNGNLCDTKKPKILDFGVEINQIKIGYIGKEPVLVACGENGCVNIYKVKKLDEEPVRLSNGKESTWSLSISGPYVAVGANNYLVTLWDSIKKTKIFLEGHEHNIPCVEISPCHKYIISASIDKSIILWNTDGKLLKRNKFQKEWGWGVKWIPINTVKVMEKDEYINAIDMSQINTNTYQEIESTDEEEIGEKEEKKEEEELKDQSLNDYLIIYTTKKEIYLLNSSLEMLDYLTFDPGFHILRFLGFQKLAMIEYLPEFSCLIIGTHLKKIILFVRIVKDLHGFYKLIPENKIATERPLSIILGIAIKKIKTFSNQTRYQIFLTDIECVEIYEIRSKESEIMGELI